MEQIVVGAGCFWGVQFFFDQISGVVETEVGYSGGHTESPTYEDVCYENTGHAEVCRVVFDAHAINLEQILHYFFMMHDPTLLNRQGPDSGTQYRSIILYSDGQNDVIKSSLQDAQKRYASPIVTQVVPLETFWPAEEYHQKYTQRTGRGACHVMPGDIEPLSAEA